MNRIGRHCLLGAGMLVASSSASALEEFFTSPGARAMGMGGAFTAIGTDVSALWYNPAGLGLMPAGVSDFTIDYGDVVRPIEFGDLDFSSGTADLYEEESEIKYVGIGGNDGEWGAGIAYFRPYNFYSSAEGSSSGTFGGTQRANIETQYQEIRFGVALGGGEDGHDVSFGFTGDLILVETDSDCASCTEVDELDVGFTLGLMGRHRISDEVGTLFHWGGMYRTAGDTEGINADFEQVPSRPETVSLGIGFTQPFQIDDWFMSAVVSGQRDTMQYEDISFIGPNTQALDVEHERTAFGAELQIVSPGGWNFFLRGGTYESEADGDTITVGTDTSFRPYSKGLEGTTFGFGIYLGDWVLDYARETRTILESDYTDIGDQDLDLQSFSVSRVF